MSKILVLELRELECLPMVNIRLTRNPAGVGHVCYVDMDQYRGNVGRLPTFCFDMVVNQSDNGIYLVLSNKDDTNFFDDLVHILENFKAKADMFDTTDAKFLSIIRNHQRPDPADAAKYEVVRRFESVLYPDESDNRCSCVTGGADYCMVHQS